MPSVEVVSWERITEKALNKAVRAVLARFSVSEEDAWDAVHGAALHLVEFSIEARNVERVLAVAAQNRLLDELRRRARWKFRAATERDGAQMDPDALASEKLDPSAIAEVKEEREQARQRIDVAWPLLASEDRWVLSDYYFQTVGTRERERRAILHGRRSSKLFRARQRLRTLLMSGDGVAKRR